MVTFKSGYGIKELTACDAEIDNWSDFFYPGDIAYFLYRMHGCWPVLPYLMTFYKWDMDGYRYVQQKQHNILIEAGYMGYIWGRTYFKDVDVGYWKVVYYNREIYFNVIAKGTPKPPTPPEIEEQEIFKSIGDWFYAYRDVLIMGVLFEAVADLFYGADIWAASVLSAIQKIPTFDGLRIQFEAAYDILIHSWFDVTSYVDNKIADIEIPGMPGMLSIYNGVKGYFESGYDILTHSWFDVTSYVDNKIAGIDIEIPEVPSWDTIFDKVNEQFGLTTIRDFVIDSSQWFSKKLEEAMDGILDKVADKFEYILDKVFK